jgi:hypothetical protein
MTGRTIIRAHRSATSQQLIANNLRFFGWRECLKQMNYSDGEFLCSSSQFFRSAVHLAPLQHSRALLPRQFGFFGNSGIFGNIHYFDLLRY